MTSVALVPGAGLTEYEQMGLSSKTDRFSGGYERLGTGPMSSQNQSKMFDRLETFSKLMRPPPTWAELPERVLPLRVSVPP